MIESKLRTSAAKVLNLLQADLDVTFFVEILWMKLVTVKLPEALLEGLDELIKAGMYQSRSAAIRSAVRDLLKRELWRTETP